MYRRAFLGTVSTGLLSGCVSTVSDFGGQSDGTATTRTSHPELTVRQARSVEGGRDSDEDFAIHGFVENTGDLGVVQAKVTGEFNDSTGETIATDFDRIHVLFPGDIREVWLSYSGDQAAAIESTRLRVKKVQRIGIPSPDNVSADISSFKRDKGGLWEKPKLKGEIQYTGETKNEVLTIWVAFYAENGHVVADGAHNFVDVMPDSNRSFTVHATNTLSDWHTRIEDYDWVFQI